MMKKVVQAKKNCDTFCLSYCYKVISEDLRKHFYHKPQESLPDTKPVLLENRRVALSGRMNSRASRFLESLLFL